MRLAAAAAVYQHWFGPRTRYKIYEISRAKKQFRLAAVYQHWYLGEGAIP